MSSSFTDNLFEYFKDYLKFIIVPLTITSLIAAVCYSCYKHRKSKKAIKRFAKRKGEITSTPVIPQWLTENAHFYTVKIEGGVRIESRCDVQQRIKDGLHPHFNLGDSLIPVYWWLRYYLHRKFGPAVFCLPLDVSLVSVPMKGFSCVPDDPTTFEKDSKKPGHLIYQMCGNEAIQISYHVSKDEVLVAGYCIYIRDGRADSDHYYRKHIEEFEIPEVPREKEDILIMI